MFCILESLRWPKTFTEPKAGTKLLTVPMTNQINAQSCQHARCWALSSTPHLESPHSGALSCQHLPKRMVFQRNARGWLAPTDVGSSFKASCRDSSRQEARWVWLWKWYSLKLTFALEEFTHSSDASDKFVKDRSWTHFLSRHSRCAQKSY